MILAKINIKLSLIFLVSLILTGCMSESEKLARSRMPTSQMTQTSKPGTRMDIDPSNLGWQLNDGQRQTLSDYRGKAVILDFWATYCPPCIEGIPHFNDLKRRYESQGLQVVGLNVGGEEDKPKIPEFVERLQISYRLGYPEPGLTDFYFQGDTRIPQTLVFDRNGQLVEQFVGFTPEIKEGIDAAVLQALKNQ